jgi:Uncharacterized protein conserved in bacteria
MSSKTPNEVLIEKTTQAKNQVTIGAKYLHSKTKKHYKVVDIAIFSENTGQLFVVYEQLYGESLIFARPIEMWNEAVEIDGKITPRFVIQ